MPVSLPFFQKKESKKYFLALLLREEKIHAVLLEESQGNLQIVSKSQEYFSSSIEEANEEEFLHVLDKTITNVEQTTNLEFPTHQTVFGIKQNWIEDGKIKKPYLAKLKKASDELGLSPIGFLEIHEAINHHLKKHEGAPISAVLIEAGRRSLTVSVIKAGRIIETKSALVEGSYAHTVDKLLKEFTISEILPSKITIYNDDKNEELLVQEFIGHSWSKSLPFLHVPQITTLSKDFGIFAIITASAAQMGFEVLDEDSQIHEQSEKEKESEPKQEDETLTVASEISDRQNDKPEPIPESETEQEENLLEEFGFQKDTDIAKEEKTTRPQPKVGQSFTLIPIISILKKFFGSLNLAWHTYLKHNLKKTNVIFRIFPGKLLIPLAGIGVITIGILAWYIFAVKATVTLFIDPKTIKQTQDVSFAQGTPSDFSKDTISAQFETITQEGSINQAVTGKKEVGEKAKGSVTLYSRFTQEKTLPTGTTVTSSNGIVFTFDDSIKLASASAGASSSPSTAKVNVTAKQIGKESNLPSGTKFTVASFDISDIEAKNESAFSGGTKKEITAVSKDDMQKALNELPKQLEQKARDELNKKAAKDNEILPSFMSQKVAKKEFDKKEGDESKSLQLKGEVEFVGVLYKKSDFISYATQILSNRFPSNFTVSPDIKTTVKNIKQKNENTVVTIIDIKALLLPKIETDNLKKQIIGKDFADAKTILTKLPQVSDISIKQSPALSFLPKFLPRISSNIDIRTKLND